MISRLFVFFFLSAFLAVLQACDVGGPVQSNEHPPPPHDLDALLDEGLTDPEALLAAAPDELLDHAVLLEHSAHGASLQRPRVVMFGAGARLLLSWSTDPADSSVLFAQLDEDSGRWHFEGRDGGEPVEDDCSSCHGSPARPIFDPEDAFGGERGVLTAAQAAALERALTDPSHRLSRLPLDFEPGDRTLLLPQRYDGVPARTLAHELSAALAEGLVRRMERTEAYDVERDALLLEEHCWPMSEALEVAFEEMAEPGASWRGLGVRPARDLALDAPASEDAGDRFVGGVSSRSLVAFLVLDAVLEDTPELSAPFEAVDHHRRRMLRDWWQLRGADRRALFRAGSEVPLTPEALVVEALGDAHDERRAHFCTELAERYLAR